MTHKRKRFAQDIAYDIQKTGINPHGCKKPKHGHSDSINVYKISINVIVRNYIDQFIDFVVKQMKNFTVNNIIGCTGSALTTATIATTTCNIIPNASHLSSSEQYDAGHHVQEEDTMDEDEAEYQYQSSPEVSIQQQQYQQQYQQQQQLSSPPSSPLVTEEWLFQALMMEQKNFENHYYDNNNNNNDGYEVDMNDSDQVYDTGEYNTYEYDDANLFNIYEYKINESDIEECEIVEYEIDEDDDGDGDGGDCDMDECDVDEVDEDNEDNEDDEDEDDEDEYVDVSTAQNYARDMSRILPPWNLNFGQKPMDPRLEYLRSEWDAAGFCKCFSVFLLHHRSNLWGTMFVCGLLFSLSLF